MKLLENESRSIDTPQADAGSAIICNVNIRLASLILLVLKRRKIILRLDGINSYPLTRNFLQRRMKFSKIFSNLLIKLASKNKKTYNFVAESINFLLNFGIFIRILFSYHLVYQSSFCRDCYAIYFPNKRYNIINNGTLFYGLENVDENVKKNSYRKILVTFHKNRPLKGTRDVLLFFEQLRQSSDQYNFKVILLGYEPNVKELDRSGNIFCYDEFLLRNNSWIIPYEKFEDFNDHISSLIWDCDFYISLARFDPCPNLMLEIMAHGLPVVACASGGVAEVVGASGILLDVEDGLHKPYFNYNYDGGVEPPTFYELKQAVDTMLLNFKRYQNILIKESLERINITNVAHKYALATNEVEKDNKCLKS